MLEITITIPDQSLFEAMRLLGSSDSRVMELTTIAGTCVQIKADKLNVKWNAESLSALPNLRNDQIKTQSTDSDP